MRRRDFFNRVFAGVAAGSLLPGAESVGAPARGRAAKPAAPDKRDRIGISTWSFHNFFSTTREKDFNLPGKMLALLDFPEMIVDRYKVHHFEFVAPHFASTEPSYLEELKARMKKTRSHLVNIPVDIKEIWTAGGLSDLDDQVSRAAIQASKKWIDIARALGAKSVRCDPGHMKPEALETTVASYKDLAAYGKSKGIRVLVENHGGVGSERPEELVKVFKAVGSDYFGALPDMGNFPNEETRMRGLPLLFPYGSVVCHAKGFEFDTQGNETRFNFPKCVEFAKQANFKGVYSIEFEGPGDPYDGVQNVVDELLRYL